MTEIDPDLAEACENMAALVRELTGREVSSAVVGWAFPLSGGKVAILRVTSDRWRGGPQRGEVCGVGYAWEVKTRDGRRTPVQQGGSGGVWSEVRPRIVEWWALVADAGPRLTDRD